ncbi:hypothetical protein [Stenotrophomonas phage BUCT627]|uniref:Uncharacterized protein n=1 Tax=Stenotrophomonas phage BUCT627 TaxID=2860377 RepID=A0AC61NA11_9CAUD|nr:hypothetical protein PQD77_gp057 [Stenotrophomonas phage BUCT627]QYC96702.1 hypothetical protein [Stenotrophomonas phage BUCT627]
MFDLFRSIFAAFISPEMGYAFIGVYLLTAAIMAVCMGLIAYGNIKEERRLSLGLLVTVLVHVFLPFYNTLFLLYVLLSIAGEALLPYSNRALDHLDEIDVLKLKGYNPPLCASRH